MYLPKISIRNDRYGQGHFGAARKNSKGPYKHEGVDFVAPLGMVVRAPFDGVITDAVVYPSASKPHLRGFDWESKNYKYRVFYAALLPELKEGDKIKKGQPIAVVQDMKYYSDMVNHLHIEIREKQNDKLINPMDFINAHGAYP